MNWILWSCSVFVAFILNLSIGAGAFAHEIKPSIVNFEIQEQNEFGISILINMEAWLANIGVEHEDTDDSPNAIQYNKLRALEEEGLRAEFEAKANDFAKSISLAIDGEKVPVTYQNVVIPPVGDMAISRDTYVFFKGKVPPNSKELTWAWDVSNGASVFRFEKPGAGENGQDVLLSTYVAAGDTSKPLLISGTQDTSAFSAFVEYIKVGFDHIIPKGLDHILFVVGIFLLSTRFSALIWQVSSFTVAHTVTLGLGMAGIVTVSPSIVEPLIAASIVYVAVENIFMDRLSPWRPVLVFGFGLLHGLGFASVLTDFGLSQGNFIAGLIGFNIGVELGQLAVIAICFLLVGFWFGKKPWYHKFVTVPGSIVIAVIASYWFYERVFLA